MSVAKRSLASDRVFDEHVESTLARLRPVCCDEHADGVDDEHEEDAEFDECLHFTEGTLHWGGVETY